MKASKSSHFSVLNFVTSGGVFSVLKPVEMCDQFLAWRAQCTSPPELIFLKSLGHSPDRGRSKILTILGGLKRAVLGSDPQNFNGRGPQS